MFGYFSLKQAPRMMFRESFVTLLSFLGCTLLITAVPVHFNSAVQGDSVPKKQALKEGRPVIDKEGGNKYHEGNGDPGFEFVFVDNPKGFLTNKENEEDDDSTSEDDYEDSYEYLDNGSDGYDEECRRKYDACLEAGSANPQKLRCQKSYFLCLLDDDEYVYGEL
ncbi:uncharacterized protein LOC143256220 [Tachypleus tridentatus]|uniref:uncharacterized protein LOC143256220 n=1 Tax=Tachypleus tridentatus TaxID=6853 RepID=UPI003FD0433B